MDDKNNNTVRGGISDELLFRCFSGAASEGERRIVGAWVSASEENRSRYRRASGLYEKWVMSAPMENIEGKPVQKGKHRQFAVRATLRRIAVAAASVAAAAFACFVSFRGGRQVQKEELASVYNVLEVPNGKVVDFALSDGTMVKLNGGSRLEYPVIFADGIRSVRFSGQGRFSVAHDEEHPFVVNTFVCDVTVLGTEFEVTADPSSGEFTTSLFEGSVKVTDRRDCSCLYLNPNQMVYMCGDRLQRCTITCDDDYLWTRGIISITDLDFGSLMTKFERAFGVKIDIRRETMPELRFISGKMYVCEGIENALRTLQRGCDFSYTLDQETGVVVIR